MIALLFHILDMIPLLFLVPYIDIYRHDSIVISGPIHLNINIIA